MKKIQWMKKIKNPENSKNAENLGEKEVDNRRAKRGEKNEQSRIFAKKNTGGDGVGEDWVSLLLLESCILVCA